MTPDRAALDFLQSKAAEYRRHAQSLTAGKLSDHLLEVARLYETRLHELEANLPAPRRIRR